MNGFLVGESVLESGDAMQLLLEIVQHGGEQGAQVKDLRTVTKGLAAGGKNTTNDRGRLRIIPEFKETLQETRLVLTEPKNTEPFRMMKLK